MWEWRTIARSPADPSGGMADRHEIQCPVEVVRPELEVRTRDRRGEAVIEGLRQTEPLVHGIPPRLARELVKPQLASVEEAEELHAGKVRLAKPAELVRAVLVNVPGVVGLLRARRRQ